MATRRKRRRSFDARSMTFCPAWLTRYSSDVIPLMARFASRPTV